jgi:hypothetical protein
VHTPSRPRLFAAAAAAWLAALAACGDGAPFVGYVSRSDFFEYHDQVDETLCPSLLSLLDEHARTVGGQLGLRFDASRRFGYYRFADPDAFRASFEADGKAFGNDLFSPDYFEPHEQAHVYTFRVWGRWSTDWINEGEAVALSCEPTQDPSSSTTPRALLAASDWRTQLYANLFSPAGYAAAGFLITHLARQYGWERVGRLHQRVPPGASQADFERTFAEVFPIAMDQAWAETLDTPGEPACDRTWTCRATSLAPGEHIQPACDGRLYAAVTVPSDAGGVVLDVAEDEGITLSGRCADATAPWYPLPGSAAGTGAVHWALVPPGPYTLFAGASSDDVSPARPAAVTDGEFTPRAAAPSSVGLQAYVPPGLTSEACATAGTVSLAPAASTYIDLVRGYDDTWIQIDGGGRSFAATTVNLSGTETAAAAELCDGCGPNTTCWPLPSAARALVAGTVLHLQHLTVERRPAAGQIVFVPASPAL